MLSRSMAWPLLPPTPVERIVPALMIEIVPLLILILDWIPSPGPGRNAPALLVMVTLAVVLVTKRMVRAAPEPVDWIVPELVKKLAVAPPIIETAGLGGAAT